MRNDSSRRRFLRNLCAVAGGVLVAGCDALSRRPGFTQVLGAAERLNRTLHHALAPRRSMAQEFSEADLSPYFRSNGTDDPDDPYYQSLARNGFADWRLQVDGMVERAAQLSLAQLRTMPSRTQITRHDCVEGWSAIGKWKGVPLSEVLALVQPRTTARYIVFHCADPMDASGKRYYDASTWRTPITPRRYLPTN